MAGQRPADSLSEALQRDFHVADAAIALIDLGDAPLRVPRSATPRLHLVLEGEITVSCDGHPPERLGPGDTVLLIYGDTHRLAAHTDKKRQEICLPPLAGTQIERIDTAGGFRRAALLSFQIELSYVAPAAAAIRAGPAIRTLHRTPAEGQLQALRLDPGQIEEACSGPGARAFCLALANMLIVHAVRAMYRAQWNDGRMEVRSPVTRRVAAAVQAIEAHPERPWTVASLAHSVGISRSSFAAAFRDALGVAPLAYVRHIRLERARRMLEAGGLSVTEVARRSGYPLPSSFARAFSQRYGRPPSRE